jgi:hypothetical protein
MTGEVEPARLAVVEAYSDSYGPADVDVFRDASSQMCGQDEELWVLTDLARIGHFRAPHAVAITNRHLFAIGARYTVEPLLAIPTSALSVRFASNSEVGYKRSDGGIARSECSVAIKFIGQHGSRLSTAVQEAIRGQRPAPIVVGRAVAGHQVPALFLGGHGLGVPVGTEGVLVFRPDHTGFVSSSGTPLWSTPTAAITDVAFGGPGAWQKGGRVVGGGFGAVGAVEGMLVAAAMNKVTTRKGVTTIITMSVGHELTGFWEHDKLTPAQLTIELSWLSASAAATRARLAQSGWSVVVAEAESPGLATQLKELAGLHEQGVLTHDEFAQAKAKLLCR